MLSLIFAFEIHWTFILHQYLGNNFTLFYHYVQARMKLEKRPQNALVGVANPLLGHYSRQYLATPNKDHNDGKSKQTPIEMAILSGGNICSSKK